jgi:hypothetical protein
MNVAVMRTMRDTQRLRQIATQSRQAHQARLATVRTSTDADAKLARLRKVRQARDKVERHRAELRRLANPVRLVLIGSFLFYLGLSGLYFVSVARDLL